MGKCRDHCCARAASDNHRVIIRDLSSAAIDIHNSRHNYRNACAAGAPVDDGGLYCRDHSPRRATVNAFDFMCKGIRFRLCSTTSAVDALDLTLTSLADSV